VFVTIDHAPDTRSYIAEAQLIRQETTKGVLLHHFTISADRDRPTRAYEIASQDVQRYSFTAFVRFAAETLAQCVQGDNAQFNATLARVDELTAPAAAR
jgi:hypothetical protein